MAHKSEQQWQMLTAAYLEEFSEIAASNAKKMQNQLFKTPIQWSLFVSQSYKQQQNPVKYFPPHSKKWSSTREVRLCAKQDHAAGSRDCPCADIHPSSPPGQHHRSPGPTEGEDGTDFGQLTGCVGQLECVCHPTGLAMGGSRPRDAILMMMASTEALSFNVERPCLSPSAPFWRVCLGDSNPEHTCMRIR